MDTQNMDLFIQAAQVDEWVGGNKHLLHGKIAFWMKGNTYPLPLPLQAVSGRSDFPEERRKSATTAAGTTARAATRTTPFSSPHAFCTTGTPANTRCSSKHT